jgi:RNA polymerase sigma factor (sigma-70 family)
VERHARAELQRNLQRLAEGDRAAFRPLFDLAWPTVQRVATRMMSSAADADDAAQGALLKLFERACEFDSARDALAWIVGIVSYECLSLRKKRARRREHDGAALDAVADERAGAEELVMARELEEIALAAVEELRPEDRATIRAALFGDVERAGKPATFRKRLERALGRLRAAWRDHGVG